ncbi:sortase [Candidatus Saccharibacteria bacterium]|nr:sortase [Candidatus Saccharibacteria bacterium]
MTLRRFNNLLSILVIMLGVYIAISPFIPEITYKFRDKSPEHVAPYSGELAKEYGSRTEVSPPTENRLVIPSIGLNEIIKEGNYINVIKDGGTWHRPNTVTPDQSGNSVIVGHRFYGSNLSTFYNLDKVVAGDKLAIYWDGVELLYEVFEVKVVDPTAVEIESPTATRQLTLCTCHPLWTSSQRLVVIARPVNLEENVNAE